MDAATSRRPVNIGLAIRGMRKALGFSLGALASRAGITKSGLWEIEKGTSDPRLSTFLAICAALDASPSALLDEKSFDSVSHHEWQMVRLFRAAVTAEAMKQETH